MPARFEDNARDFARRVSDADGAGDVLSALAQYDGRLKDLIDQIENNKSQMDDALGFIRVLLNTQQAATSGTSGNGRNQAQWQNVLGRILSPSEE